MKHSIYNIVFVYYLIGILIFIFDIQLYTYWYIFIVPLTIYLIIKSGFLFKVKLDLFLTYIYSIFSLLFNIINSNFSIIPFYIITNTIFSKSNIKQVIRIYQVSKLIAILGLLVYFLNIIFTGNYFATSPFLFSKNMAILPFIPFVAFFHFEDRNKFDFFLYLLTLILFLFSFSLGNFFMAILLFIAVFLPDKSLLEVFKKIKFKNSELKFKSFRKIIFKIFIFGLTIYFLNFTINYLDKNISSLEFQTSKEKFLNFFDSSLYNLRDFSRIFPRIDILFQYINSLSLAQIFIGNPNISFDLYIPLSRVNTENPHNSLILAHMNMGIFGIFFYIQIFVKIFHISIKKNLRLSLVAFTILLRSFTDIILVLSGFSSFVLFFLLFNPYIFARVGFNNKNFL